MGASLIRDRTTGRGKTFRLVVAGVGLSRLEGAPFGGNFGSLRLDRHQVIAESAESRVREQLLKDHLRHLVGALAEVMGSDPSLGIREIERRPVVVVERPPDPVVGVDRDRVVDAQCFSLLADVVNVSLNGNSGVWTPITTRLLPPYFSAQARTYGNVRSQLTQVKVQKSTRTTFPRRSAGDNGSELSHAVAPANEASPPSTGSFAALALSSRIS